MKKDTDVCGVMVTFRPPPEALNNIILLMQQVKHLVVVDNGSGPGAIDLLHAPRVECGFTLIKNESNAGIAAALNTGVKYALSRGYRWVVLFDQDSTVTEDFMSAMLDGYSHHPRRDFVAVFCPRYVDRSTGLAVLTSRLHPDGGPRVAMTSGSLMPAWAFERCGWFLEELFIDQVDVEYCFRVRSSGYLIARSAGARLLHSAGNPRTHRVWGLGSFRATHHTAARRYYLTRNRVWVVRKFWREHRDWCIPMIRSIVTDTLKLVIVEKQKIAKLRSTYTGIRDALIGRLGKTLDL